MKKVFYVSYGGGHANISRFIYKEMEKDPDVEQEVLSLTVADKIFDRSNVPYRHLTDYLNLAFSPEDKKEILRLGKELAESAHNPNSDVPYKQTVAYMGCGMWDLVKRFGEDEARKMFAKEERKAFWPIEAMRAIFSYVKPDVLVVTCEVRMEGAAIDVANELGIKVVFVSDMPSAIVSNKPDYVCVINEYSKKYALENYKVDESRIVVTGQPVFEDDLNIENENIQKAKEDFDVDHKKVILYLAASGRADDRQIVSELDRLADIEKDYRVIIKIHPNFPEDMYNLKYNKAVITKNYKLNALLHMCDVAITIVSTAGLEAAIVGKPLIHAVLTPEQFDCTVFGVSERVSDVSELKETIEKCLDKNSEVYKRLEIGRKHFEMKRNCSKNIADVIRYA